MAYKLMALEHQRHDVGLVCNVGAHIVAGCSAIIVVCGKISRYQFIKLRIGNRAVVHRRAGREQLARVKVAV